MQRNEAVSYLKAVLSSDQSLSPDAITLEATKGQNGYKVHIKGAYVKATVKEIAQKRNLAVKEEKDEMVVFRP